MTVAYFDTNSPTPLDNSALGLQGAAELIKRCLCPATVHGYADHRDTDYVDGNRGLSLDRATNVRDRLVHGYGVPAQLIVSVKGHGTENEIPNDLAASRRVEVTLECG